MKAATNCTYILADNTRHRGEHHTERERRWRRSDELIMGYKARYGEDVIGTADFDRTTIHGGQSAHFGHATK